MKGFLIVLERELAERRLILLTGLLGFFPLLLPLFHSAASTGDRELRGMLALGLAGLVSGVLALILGASIIAGDLAAGRLGFYFARPLPGWAIWAGKMAAGLALSLGAAILVIAPVWVVDPNARRLLDAATVVQWTAVLLVVLFTAHGVSLLVRSRSPLLALDLAAGIAVALVSLAAGRDLYRNTFSSTFAVIILGETLLPMVLVLALAAAGFVQVVGGRSDLRRGHRLFSTALWLPLAAAALGFAGYVRFVLAAGPQDLAVIESVLTAPQGSWFYVEGVAAHRGGYKPAFLVDAASGHSRLLSQAVRAPLFSRNGRRAVWLAKEGASASDSFALMSARLDAGRASLGPPIHLAQYPDSIALSPEGDRVAVITDGRLIVEELPDGRLLASAVVAGATPWHPLAFADRDHVRVYTPTAKAGTYQVFTAVAELGVSSGRLVPTGSFAGEDMFPLSFSPEDGRLFRRGPLAGSPFEVLDARTGALLATLPPPVPPAAAIRALFLPDGHLLQVISDGDDRELRLATAAGAELSRCRFSGVSTLRIAGQPAPGRLAVTALGSGETAGTEWLIDLDLATCRLRPLARGLTPVRTLDPPSPSALGPQSLGSRLFRAGARLVILDPATGGVRPVLGRG